VSPQGVAENFILYYTETAEFSEIPMEVAMGGALKKRCQAYFYFEEFKKYGLPTFGIPIQDFSRWTRFGGV